MIRYMIFCFKHFKKIIIVFISLIFVCVLFYNKDSFLKKIGEATFGGCCYNLTVARVAYTAMAWQPFDKKPPRWAHHQLARIYFVRGDFNTALTYIDRETKDYPDNLNAYYIKGLILGFMNNNHEAIDVFKYYTSQTHTWAGHNDLAWLQFRTGDYAGALATIDKVMGTYTDNVWLLNTRAICLHNLNRDKEAKIDIDKAVIHLKDMTPERWGASYPGNDPSVYREGLAQMKKSVEENKKLIYQSVYKVL